MVPVKGFSLEAQGDYDREDGQRDYLLDDLELHQVEGTSVDCRADAVTRDLKAVFEEGNAPGEEYDQNERPSVGDVHFLEFQMSVPGEGHTDVRADQKQYAPERVHVN